MFAVTAVSAQNVSWKSTVEHLDGDMYRIVLEASIPAPYHMYDMGPYEGGPNATTITFTAGAGATLEGGVEQLSTPERHYDKTFEMEIGTFAGKALFAQRVKLAAEKAAVTAQLEWMICDDTSCMPPEDTEMTIDLTAQAGAATASAATPQDTAPAGTADKAALAKALDNADGGSAQAAAEPAQKDAAGGGSLWALIIEAILWGFAALLTPCVFPMVPMTVSFFMKSSGSPAMGRFRAGMYGFFIVALYSDDKKVLPESDWVTTDAGKVLKSLGKINSYYALKTYGVNAQPYYVLQGRNGKQLVPPRGYDLNVDNFVGFLKSGVEAYNAQK